MSNIKILNWNVNGIRANYKKGIFNNLFDGQYDIVCIQESKATYSELGEEFYPKEYEVFHNSATEKKGYSGTAIYVKKSFVCNREELVSYETINTEGRLIVLKFDTFILITCYFPNGGGDTHRYDYKVNFYKEFTKYCEDLKIKYKLPIIFCGDLNIANNEIDLARPKENMKSIGFLREERDLLDKLQSNGFVDVYRNLNPDTVKYSWWDQKTRSRDRNIGWRIDAFYLDSSFIRNVVNADILTDYMGSDHCPLILEIKE